MTPKEYGELDDRFLAKLNELKALKETLTDSTAKMLNAGNIETILDARSILLQHQIEYERMTDNGQIN